MKSRLHMGTSQWVNVFKTDTVGWRITESNIDYFTLELFVYTLASDPRRVTRLTGTFASMLITDGRSGMTGNWRLENPIERIENCPYNPHS